MNASKLAYNIFLFSFLIVVVGVLQFGDAKRFLGESSFEVFTKRRYYLPNNLETSGSGSGGDEDKDSVKTNLSIPDDETEKLERATENEGLDIQGDKPTEYVRYGDIMMTDEEDDHHFGQLTNKSKSSKKDAMADFTMYWSLEIPIQIDSSLQQNRKAVNAIEAAVEEFREKTCLNLVPKTEHTSYIKLFKGKGCWSKLGKQGGEQKLSLGDGCESKATAVHELMHAIGFVHEHQRSDRDNYVDIKWENIKEEKKHNFKRQNIPMTTFDQPYDYESVMHYKSDAFSRPCLFCLRNRYTTIAKKDDPNGFFGFGQPRNGGLSKIDQRQINIMYCEIPRPADLIKDGGKFGLERFIKQRLQEYENILSPDFHQVVSKTLEKVFPDYKFSLNIYTETNNPKTTAFICANCAYSLNHNGVSILVAYANENSKFPEKSVAEKLGRKAKTKVESLKLCDAVKISSEITKIFAQEISVSMVFVTDFDDTILIKDKDAKHVMSLYISCVDNEDGKGYIAVVLFGE